MRAASVERQLLFVMARAEVRGDGARMRALVERWIGERDARRSRCPRARAPPAPPPSRSRCRPRGRRPAARRRRAACAPPPAAASRAARPPRRRRGGDARCRRSRAASSAPRHAARRRRRTSARVAGGSLRTPAGCVRGATTYSSASTRRAPRGRARAAPPDARAAPSASRRTQPRAVGVIVERLLAEAIAREQQAPRARVPQREGEHAVELADAVVAPLPIGVEDAPRCRSA